MSTALADEPVEIEGSITPTDVNPCTGELHMLTIEYSLRLHVHDGRTVQHFSRTGWTDSGYVLQQGVRTDQFNGEAEQRVVIDNWSNPDGSRIQLRYVFVFNANLGDLVFTDFTLRCIR
ncbi:hypothetical protein [Agromyces sp. SYSU T00266]|uniref:hypothetical protein n=1 Tax=Agromyces zhanjiangensis TaxID=3158562 RepID=UPI003394B55D